MAAQPTDLLFTAAPCQAEILAGIEVLPTGQRQQALAEAARAMFAEDFEGRVLPFDDEAARAYAAIFAARRRVGRPGTPFDLMIAAIARSLGASVVTRNTADFDGCGVEVINPWEAYRAIG